MSSQRVSREPCKHTCGTLDEIQRLLDELRTSNDLLRAWGNEEADARDRAERELAELRAERAAQRGQP